MSRNLFCKLFGHKFGEWEYVAEDSCEQIRVCKRDGHEERRKWPHQFGEWEYVADNSCWKRGICIRCGHTQSHEKHNWEETVISEKPRMEKIGRTPFHTGESKYEYWTDVTISSICTRCGKSETRIEKRYDRTEVH